MTQTQNSRSPEGHHPSAAQALFDSLDHDQSGTIDAIELTLYLNQCGFHDDDPRFKAVFRGAAHGSGTRSFSSPHPAFGKSPSSYPYRHADSLRQKHRKLSFDEMVALLGPTLPLVERAFVGDLAIPNFESFRESIREIFETVKAKDYGGNVASYIPQLAAVDPNKFGLSFCSIDGQRFNFGDSETDFCVESCCKPIQYCIALEDVGATKVHSHIGREPSGRSFNHMSLLDNKRPFNPMLNAGAIVSCSLIQKGKPLYSRFDHVMKTWSKLYGGAKVSFNNSVYLSERETADRNYALGYMMKEAGAFPPDTDLQETLEFYFQCCSLEGTTDKMATMASTLANGGVCPLTGEHVFEPGTVRNCLSLMATCGMYDYSGEWHFTVGIPAKSGVSGAIFAVIPGVGGFCCWSPPVDSIGNSRKAVEIFKALSDRFTFHLLEPSRLRALKVDPTLDRNRPGSRKASIRTLKSSANSCGYGSREQSPERARTSKTSSFEVGMDNVRDVPAHAAHLISLFENPEKEKADSVRSLPRSIRLSEDETLSSEAVSLGRKTSLRKWFRRFSNQ
ncbi:hypothetical protein HDU97_006972 [Phlyctochytrium planicorne]|nr:hypothetical protein HDU97_006972 [Phlyctochytrium planicorne]